MEDSMTTYTATLSHHSISRAREIRVTGTLTAAKRAATREFGDEHRDYSIVILDEQGDTVAKRRVAPGCAWTDYR